MSSTYASVRGHNIDVYAGRFTKGDRLFGSRCIPSQSCHHVVNHIRSVVRRLVNNTSKTNVGSEDLDGYTTSDGNSGFSLARHDDSVAENDSIIKETVVVSLQHEEPSIVELPKQTNEAEQLHKNSVPADDYDVRRPSYRQPVRRHRRQCQLDLYEVSNGRR